VLKLKTTNRFEKDFKKARKNNSSVRTQMQPPSLLEFFSVSMLDSLGALEQDLQGR
jgi:hypothetical protein